MMIKLRFAVEVEFDSQQTANAYGVALGFKLADIERNALDLSEAPAPALARGKIEVTEATRG